LSYGKVCAHAYAGHTQATGRNSGEVRRLTFLQ